MGKLNVVSLDAHPRGDSGVLRWSWVKKESDNTTTALSLVGYKVSLTVKANQYDTDEGDDTAMVGYGDTLWRVDIDCDNSTDMHGLDPAEGKVIFPMPKQATWVNPGTYWIDIVVENKASYRTTTVFLGKIEVQGHPTNRRTTDHTDDFSDITE